MSLKHAMLGLLQIAPMTGYLLKENLESGMGGFWSASFGGIYPALHQMMEEGWVKVEAMGDPRNQKVYQITPEGQQELERWIAQQTVWPKTKDEYMLKIFLTADSNRQQRKRLLEEYIQFKTRCLNEILERVNMDGVVLSDGMRIVTRFGVEALQHEIEILQQILAEEVAKHD